LHTANQNGILDGPAEDVNLNGTLEPGNVVTVPPTVALDENGVAEFDLTYPQDRAFWVKVTLQAVASVAGTESIETVTFDLPGLASDFACANSPPGYVSPYGTSASCADPN
jgi:hypothetical protein